MISRRRWWSSGDGGGGGGGKFILEEEKIKIKATAELKDQTEDFPAKLQSENPSSTEMFQARNPAISSSRRGIPVIETYWTLVDKADRKLSKIRNLPCYERNRYNMYFHKAFKVYTQLWKFQQEHRQQLVEAGLKRWEIGEIASRIAQLYFGQYMRTSEASYLSESYVFYKAILTREYFKDGLFQDVNLAIKQLRFLSSFLMVCLVLNRREMVLQLVDQLKVLLNECKKALQETDFKEWELIVQEIMKFMEADTAFMNIRPFRYSVVLDPHPESMTPVPPTLTKRHLRLQEVILSSYHHNEVKFCELTLDTFRMIQSLEWEPRGLFYQPNTNKSGSGPSRSSFSLDIVDPTLPFNPRKSILYRPSVTYFLAVLATICEEMPSDGVLLIYLSASGNGKNVLSSPAATQLSSESISNKENIDKTRSPCGQVEGDCIGPQTGCLSFSDHEKEDLGSYQSCIYPSDLVPFTRTPLLLVIDSDVSDAFETIHGAEKGEPAAMLLSASSHTVAADNCNHGSLFTLFLTAPLHAFILLLGISASDVEKDTFSESEKVLSSSLSEWEQTLVTSRNLHQVWAQILNDPFIRRLLLRFIFCRTVLALYVPTFGKKEFVPRCVPSLPSFVDPMSAMLQSVVGRIANIFDVSRSFIYSKDSVLLKPSNEMCLQNARS